MEKPRFKEGDKVKEISSGREGVVTPGGGVKVDDRPAGQGGTLSLIYVYQVRHNDDGVIRDAREDALKLLK